jgi:hypothetical protein
MAQIFGASPLSSKLFAKIGEAVPPSPFGKATVGGAVFDSNTAAGDFSRRYGFARLGQQTNDLATSLRDPAHQLDVVNQEYANIVASLTTRFADIGIKLRELNLSDEEILFRTDAYIKPQIATEMELLRLKYPFAVGGAAGGSFNPLAGLASGLGNENQFQAGHQFQNFRALKKAFKARKKHRASKRARTG